MNKIKPYTRQYTFFGCLVCAMAALFYCYEFFLRIVPGALHNELMAAFGNISASTFGGLSALYYFAYSPMQLPVGMLMDRYGPRRLLSFACLCCTIGSFMFCYSGSLLIAGIGRFLVGFGSSFAFVGVLSLALQWLPRRYFSFVAGLVTTLAMLGLVYGEIKTTTLALTMGASFVLNAMVVMGFALTVLIALVVRDGPNDTPTVKQALPEFFRQVMRVLMSKQVWLFGFIGACLYTSLSVFGELWGKIYLEQAHHLSDIDAAKAVSSVFIGWAVGAPLAGYLADHTGRRVLLLIVGSLMSLLCISVVLYCDSLSYFSLNLLLFLYGVFSGVEIIVFLMAKDYSGATLSATAFAATNMIVSLAGVVFQPLVGWLLDLASQFDQTAIKHVYMVSDYRIALSILPLFLILVVFALLFLKDRSALSAVGLASEA